MILRIKLRKNKIKNLKIIILNNKMTKIIKMKILIYKMNYKIGFCFLIYMIIIYIFKYYFR